MNSKLFEALGFFWNRNEIPANIPTSSTEDICYRFHKMLPEFTYDAMVLEDNLLSHQDIEELIETKICPDKIQTFDQEQALNFIKGSIWLLNEIKNNSFSATKEIFLKLNGMVAKNEALECGLFRGEGSELNYSPCVSLGDKGIHKPLPTIQNAPELNKTFNDGLKELDKLPPFEKALAFFLFGSLQQFFFDGNKRTSRLMMNGILMSHNINAMSIPANRIQDFNEKMVNFYISKDGTDMMDFLNSCHPDCRNICFTENVSQNKNEKHATNKMKP